MWRDRWSATEPDVIRLTRDQTPETQEFFGADDGIRTRDPHLGKVMLYQLSHVRADRRQLALPQPREADLVGIERKWLSW